MKPAVAVAVFLVGVAAGALVFGGGVGMTDGNTTDAGDGDGDANRTRDVPVATASPADQPYEYRLNETASPDVSDLNTSRVESLVIEEVNDVRANRSVAPVEGVEALSDPAREHSANMSDSFYLGHVEPDGSSVEERYLDGCASLRDGRSEMRYSENVASVWYKTVFNSSGTEGTTLLVTEEGVAEALVAEWINSASHRRNMLGENWTTTGVGVVVGENGAVFGTQAFCTAG